MSKKILLGLAGLIVVVMFSVGIFLFSPSGFKVLSVSPSPDKFSTGTAVLRIHLSQDVESVGKVTVSPSVEVGNPTISGKLVSYKVSGLFQQNTKYEMIFSSFSSKKGKEIHNYKYAFTPKYIPYGNLSAEQKKASVGASDSNQVDDPFLNNSFPVLGDEYLMEVGKIDGTKDVYVTIKILAEVPDYDHAGRIKQVSHDKAESIRKKALDKIRSLGGNPSNYTIIYSDNYLNNKYYLVDDTE